MISDFKSGRLKASELQSRIDKGANINAQDEQGSTILHYAVSKDFFGNGSISDFGKYYDNLKEVLSYKPNVNIANEKDETPLSIVIGLTKFRNWPDAIRLLFDHGALLRQKDKPNTLFQPEGLRYGEIPILLSQQVVKQIKTAKGKKAYFENDLSFSSTTDLLKKYFKKYS
jgi:hypothetical protein